MREVEDGGRRRGEGGIGERGRGAVAVGGFTGVLAFTERRPFIEFGRPYQIAMPLCVWGCWRRNVANEWRTRMSAGEAWAHHPRCSCRAVVGLRAGRAGRCGHTHHLWIAARRSCKPANLWRVVALASCRRGCVMSRWSFANRRHWLVGRRSVVKGRGGPGRRAPAATMSAEVGARSRRVPAPTADALTGASCCRPARLVYRWEETRPAQRVLPELRRRWSRNRLAHTLRAASAIWRRRRRHHRTQAAIATRSNISPPAPLSATRFAPATGGACAASDRGPEPGPEAPTLCRIGARAEAEAGPAPRHAQRYLAPERPPDECPTRRQKGTKTRNNCAVGPCTSTQKSLGNDLAGAQHGMSGSADVACVLAPKRA